MNVLDMLEKNGIVAKKASSTNGGEYHSACPGCGDTSKPHSDRFHVWPAQRENGSYWCRGCGKKGDAIQFLIDFAGKSFIEAARMVGKDVTIHKKNVGNETKVIKQQWQPAPVSDFRAENPDIYKEKLKKFVMWAHGWLLQTPAQLAFLKKRGINIDTIKKFLLGWNPGDGGKKAIFRPRRAWGLSIEMQDGKEKRLWLPRGLVIPYFLDGCGEDIVRARIRRINEDITADFAQRYFVVPGGKMNRMKIDSTTSGTAAWVIVESELDAMMIWQAVGDLCGVVAMGTSHAKPDLECHVVLNKDSVCILNALDFDKAGADGWKWWQEHYSNIERWPAPAGKDPGDAYRAGIDIREWIIAGLPPAALVEKKVKRHHESVKKTGVEEKVCMEPISGHGYVHENGIQELAALLVKYPVQIENTNNRLRIVEPELWAKHNKDVSFRISRLVFSDSHVLDYILKHKSQMISGSNFLQNEGS